MSDKEGPSGAIADLPPDDCPTVVSSRVTPLAPPGIAKTLPLSGGAQRPTRTLPQIDGYDLLEEIGRGGMGAVYRARQRAAGGRVVALKVMLGEAFASAAELRRFEREVEIAADLNHVNIAHIYDSGLVQGRHYFAMEYVEGQALDIFCKARDLPVNARLKLFATVCEAVSHAHRRGVIHRDLKPSNILVDKQGVPHVLDFGLAKVQVSSGDHTEEPPDLTMDGTIMGTLPYMAPEQAEGKVSAIDTRTDVYALGVILYQLLTGKYPYEVSGQMAVVLRRIAEEEPRRPSTVNRLIGDEVETIILRALNKLPDRRYSGAEDLARDIIHYLAGEPIEAKRDSGLYVLRKTLRRYWVPLAFAAGIVLLVAASAVTSFTLYRRAEVERDHAEASQRQTEQQRVLAQESAKEASRRLARQHFNEGVSCWFERQDASSAAAYFVEALSAAPEPFPAARLALHNALQEAPQMRFAPLPDSGKANITAFSPDGSKVLAAADGRSVQENLIPAGKPVRIWDARSGKPFSAPMSGTDQSPVKFALFSPDGKWVLTVAGINSFAQVWDAATGQPAFSPEHQVRASVFRPDGVHEGNMYFGVSFSPDSKRYLTICQKAVRVWDPATGQPVSESMEHEGAVSAALFSPDGNRVLTVAGERAHVWDASSGRAVSSPIQPGQAIYISAFSPDGQRILTVSGKNTQTQSTGNSMRVWSAATGEPASPSMQLADRAEVALFKPDGKTIFTGLRNKTSQFWDALKGEPLSSPISSVIFVRKAVFSPDGKALLAAVGEFVHVWDTVTGQAFSPTLQHGSMVRSALFSPDGASALTASDDQTARVWDVRTGHPCSAPMQHGGGVHTALFSPDGGMILTASADETARVWDAPTGQAVVAPLPHSDGARTAQFSPDGKWILTASEDRVVHVWDAATGEPVYAPLQLAGAGIQRGRGGLVYSAQFSPDGKRILTVAAKMNVLGEEHILRVWDATTGQPLSRPMPHDQYVNTALFSPDGKCVLTVSEDSQMRLWDAATGQPLGAPVNHHARPSTAAFSPDGKTILNLRDRNTILLLDTFTRSPLVRDIKSHSLLQIPAQPHLLVFRSATFSPDGRRVLTTLEDCTARIWDIATGEAIGVPMRHGRRINTAVFSSDGKRILTASDDSKVRVWDAATGQALTDPLKHEGPVNTAAFSPDNHWILTVADGVARVWDVATGEPVTAPMRQGQGFTSAAFSPDGKRVLITAKDRTVRVWHVADIDWDEPLELLRKHVQARLGLAVAASGNIRCLTAEELATAWSEYLRLKTDYDRSNTTRQKDGHPARN